MKASGRISLNMDMEYKSGLMDQGTKVSGNKVKLKGQENYLRQMDRFTKENSRAINTMGKEQS